MGTIYAYLYATRPWSWTASIISVLVAHVLTASPGNFFNLTLLNSIFLGAAVQCLANLVNTYFDNLNKVDTKNMSGGDRALVDGKVSPGGVVVLSIAMLVLSTLLALPLITQHSNSNSNRDDFTNNDMLVLFIVGVFLALTYTASPFNLKYYAMGDVVIMTAFGPCLMQFVSYVNSGVMNEEVTLFSIPIMLVTEAILHANNTRDIKSDAKSGATTLAVLFGFDNSVRFYTFLIAGAYVSTLWLALTRHIGLLIVFLTVPQALGLVKGISENNQKKLANVDESTAQFHMPFGILMVVGTAVSKAYLE